MTARSATRLSARSADLDRCQSDVEIPGASWSPAPFLRTSPQRDHVPAHGHEVAEHRFAVDQAQADRAAIGGQHDERIDEEQRQRWRALSARIGSLGVSRQGGDAGKVLGGHQDAGAVAVLEHEEVFGDSEQPPRHLAGPSGDDHLRPALGQIGEDSGQSRLFARLLAQPALAASLPGRLADPLVRRPPGEGGNQVVAIRLPFAHFPRNTRTRAHHGDGSVEAMDGCIFCRIIEGTLPSTEVASTPKTYAFRDLVPRAPVHVLVVPRTHITHAAELTADHGDIVAEMFTTARSVAEAEGVAKTGFRLVFNVGEDAGMSVPHLHLHVLGGRRLGWPPG